MVQKKQLFDFEHKGNEKHYFKLRPALLSLCMLTFIGGYSQTGQVNLNLKNATVKELFREIEKQTSYRFSYRDIEINNKGGITISGQGKELKEVLTNELAKQELSYTVSGNKIIVSTAKKEAVSTKEKKITGKVIDAKGEPVIGATIMEKGTTNGTITDFDGNFTLDVSNNAIIEVSYIGYQQQIIKAIYDKPLSVTLKEDTEMLDEVVVVGYGTQKKINLTGAVSVVDSKSMEDRPVPRVSQMLQGALPNVNVSYTSGYPGSSANINIRGVNSISGNASPLVLIDGIEGELDRLNPNDIASISVLKDASSAAIYGARASYGVILVTTKEGTSGKTNISYNGRFSLSNQTTSTDFETRGYYSAGINDLFFSNYNGKPYTNYTKEDYYQLWLRKDDKVENSERPWIITDNRDGRETYVYYANYDWYNHLYKQKRPMWEHNISISGGNDKLSYFLSGNMVDQTGIFRQNPDKYKVYNIRSKIIAKLSSHFTLSNNTKYHFDSYSYPGLSGINNNFNTAVNHALASFVPTNPDGTSVYITSLSNNVILDGMGAILNYGKHKNEDKRYEFATTFELTYSIIKDLNLKANYSIQNYNYITMNRSVNVPYSKYPGEIQYLNTGSGINKLSENHTNHWYQAINIFGDYSFNIIGHQFKIMAGYNFETKLFKDTKASRTGLLSDDLNDFNLATGDVYTLSGGQNEYALLGYFYRINYSYKDGRYLFETSGRYDGSSRFKKGHRFGFFPSASIGWRISEEPFFEKVKKNIDNLKIRFSYGTLGNQQVGYYDYLQTINTNGVMNYIFGNGQKGNYASVTSPNSTDLTWETVSTANLGIDLGLFNNRLNLSADAYIRDTKDMLTLGKKLPAVYGAKEPKENAANLRTKGWEIMLSWNDSFTLINKPFKYDISFGIADNTTKITKFDNPSKILDEYYVGKRLGDIWGYVVDGLFKTDEEAAAYEVDQSSVNFVINTAQVNPGLHAGDMKFVDLDGDKKISMGANTVDNPGDRKVIGNSLPRYTYNLRTGFNWYGVDFSIYFQGIGHQDWYPGKDAVMFWGPYARPYSSFIPRDFLSKVWSENNPNAYFPRPIGYLALGKDRSLGVVNDRYLQNLAYCRIKNITLGYTIPTKITKKICIEKLHIYFSGENIFTFSALKSKYIDPEQASSENSINSGTGNAKTYPWSKTYSFGLNVTF